MTVEIVLTFFRKAVSFVVVLFAVLNAYLTIVEKDKIHPTTHLGWVNEQLDISFLLFVSGIWLALNSNIKNINYRTIGPLISAAFLFIICILIYSRYFWFSAAAFATFALIDALLTLKCSKSLNPYIRKILMAVCICFLIISNCFFFAGYFTIGN